MTMAIRMKNLARKVGGVVLAVGLSHWSACMTVPSPTFTEYRGENVLPAGSGSVYAVEGIEIWQHGSPNRKCRILGVLEDSRTDTKNLRTMLQPTRDRQIAKIVKEKGGDAAVLVNEARDAKFYVSEGSGGTTIKIRTKFFVVKYTD